MVVDYSSMSSVNFAVLDLCSLIPNVPALAGNFLAGLHWRRQNVSGMSGNHSERFPGAFLQDNFEIADYPPGMPSVRPSVVWLQNAVRFWTVETYIGQ